MWKIRPIWKQMVWDLPNLIRTCFFCMLCSSKPIHLLVWRISRIQHFKHNRMIWLSRRSLDESPHKTSSSISQTSCNHHKCQTHHNPRWSKPLSQKVTKERHEIRLRNKEMGFINRHVNWKDIFLFSFSLW